MPRSDVEMIFPNTKVRFRLFDKIKFGVTAGSGLGVGVVGTCQQDRHRQQSLHAGDGAGGPRRRGRAPGQQLRQPAQPLHGGDGAQPLFPLHGRQPGRDDAARRPRGGGGHQGGDAALRHAGEAAGQRARPQGRSTRRSSTTCPRPSASTSNFDVEDALQRLKDEGIVTELADGTLQVLPPHEAALHIDKLWDTCLDQLPDMVIEEGRESDAPLAAVTSGAGCVDAPTRPMTAPCFRATRPRRRMRTRAGAWRGCARRSCGSRSTRCWCRTPTST